jgi:predicted TIM-barrel fold metal-dependent hydrolase
MVYQHKLHAGGFGGGAMGRIDVHHHWIPEEHVTNIEDHVRAGEFVKRVDLSDGQTARRVMREGMRLITLEDSMYDIEERVRRMDENGVDAAVVSAAGWTNFCDTLPMCREYNDLLAEAIDPHEDRFVGAAEVPVGTDYAAEELRRAVEELGFGAVNICTHAHGYLPDHEYYFDLYEAAQDLDVPVLVHIAPEPIPDNGMHEYDMSRTVGRPYSHHLVVARLLRSDVLERFPDLKFVHGHLGGTFMPSTFRYAENEESLESRTVATDDDFSLTRAEFEERMDHFLFATTFWDQPAIQYATNTLGTQRMAFGTDYPIREDIIGEMAETLDGIDVTDDEREAILHDNAAEWFDV